ncbi:GDP-L-fucose synthase [Acuticoccus sp. MNP-M23]|uniref:GDP-L-fucose synthase n=1 Tax=Acuticoccus sp. MNP-M23 TaxID=3072793 RepID=UPI0028164C47|nr:GDP-L-fucose synthase [Acuticoccus sp. MNP-M23]WMS40863.1 GDP-L-fucose synthase [Acuticoccus sp. MNP-M23]
MQQLHTLAGKRVFVAGHRGMVGQAIVRALGAENPAEVLTATRNELDLRDRAAVKTWLAAHKPDVVFLAAARVGGILANDTYPSEFLFDNLELETAVIRGAFEADVERLVFLGSSCIYPKMAPQPMAEDALLTGPLEPTNEWYAIAKIAGIKMCQALKRQYGAHYISVMPTNLYGPGDNFDLASSHVIPALMRKAHDAKVAGAPQMVIWGSGQPRREFMHVDDCASGILHAARFYDGYEHINIGLGTDVTIRELAELVMDVVGYTGALVTDPTKPDGTPRKLMDGARLKALGWQHQISLREGLASTYDWFVEHHAATA